MSKTKNCKWIIAAVTVVVLALVAWWLKRRGTRSAGQNNQTIDV